MHALQVRLIHILYVSVYCSGILCEQTYFTYKKNETSVWFSFNWIHNTAWMRPGKFMRFIKAKLGGRFIVHAINDNKKCETLNWSRISLCRKCTVKESWLLLHFITTCVPCTCAQCALITYSVPCSSLYPFFVYDIRNRYDFIIIIVKKFREV